MMEMLYPKKYVGSVFELDTEFLKREKINTVIFDIDNTLVPYWIKKPTKELERYFLSLKESGVTVAVLSNSKEERSRVFCEGLDIPYEYRAGKPGTGGLKKLLKRLGASPERSLLAGDQIFTDVWCANKGGLYSVLVKQVSKKDELITAPKRPFEKIVLYFYFRKTGNDGKQDKGQQ